MTLSLKPQSLSDRDNFDSHLARGKRRLFVPQRAGRINCCRAAYNRADLLPGEDISHYAYVNSTVHRNLYRVLLP